jgi:hypothetical protein
VKHRSTSNNGRQGDIMSSTHLGTSRARPRGARLRTWCAVGLVACVASGAAAAQAQADPFELTVNHAIIDLGALKGLEILDATTGDAHFSGTIEGNQVTIPAAGLSIPPKSITDPVAVTIQIKANDALTGTFDAATGALTLNANLRAETTGSATCTINPIVLTLSTTGTKPYIGVPFTAGLSGQGAIVAPWATLPKSLGGGFCDVLGQLSSGPGGLWLSHDIASPPADPCSATPKPAGCTTTTTTTPTTTTPTTTTTTTNTTTNTTPDDKKAKLSVKVVVPAKVKAGKTATFTVKLKNAGTAASNKVKVCVSGAKGLKANACATAAALKVGASKSLTLKVKTSKKNKGHTYSLKFKATSSGLDTQSATAKLKVR